jgi:hypothetical protein
VQGSNSSTSLDIIHQGSILFKSVETAVDVSLHLSLYYPYKPAQFVIHGTRGAARIDQSILAAIAARVNVDALDETPEDPLPVQFTCLIKSLKEAFGKPGHGW